MPTNGVPSRKHSYHRWSDCFGRLHRNRLFYRWHSGNFRLHFRFRIIGYGLPFFRSQSAAMEKNLTWMLVNGYRSERVETEDAEEAWRQLRSFVTSPAQPCARPVKFHSGKWHWLPVPFKHESWLSYLCRDKCYGLYNDEVGFLDAQKRCQAESGNGHLVEINDQPENDFVSEVVMATNPLAKLWTGGVVSRI